MIDEVHQSAVPLDIKLHQRLFLFLRETISILEDIIPFLSVLFLGHKLLLAFILVVGLLPTGEASVELRENGVRYHLIL